MKISPVFTALLIVTALLLAGCNQPATPATPVTTVSPSPSPELPSEVPTAVPTPSLTPVTTTSVQPAGTPDPNLRLETYVPEKAWQGMTVLADNHDLSRPRIIEVNMKGEITWEYDLPAELRTYTNPGLDTEPLPNGNILFLLPRNGVYEITRGKQVAWKYLDPKVSHDADRLPNGNTLIAFGGGDTMDDMQVKEVNPAGTIVWSWQAKSAFNHAPYLGISTEGWTHTNAVTRLSNGNTLVSLRNFNLIAEVDPSGKLVRTLCEGLCREQHDPEVQANGNILFANHGNPQAAIEMAPDGTVVWQYTISDQKAWPVRDVNRLPNRNTLITGADRIIEVTPDNEVAWALRLSGVTFGSPQEAPARGFYKAVRF